MTARNICRLEPWLVLLSGPPLVLREWFMAHAPGLVGQGLSLGLSEIVALVWIAILWVIRRAAHGRWTQRTALDVPIVALLLTLPGAVAVAMDQPAAISRAESLLFAIALYYAIANGIHSPARAWSAASWLLVSGLGLAAVGLVSVSWLYKYALLTPIIERIPRLIREIPHPTLEGAGVHPNTLAVLLAMYVPLAIVVLTWPRASRALGSAGPATPTTGSGSRGRLEAGPTVEGAAPPTNVRTLAVLLLIVALPILLLTQSRGAWLALGVALFLLAALRRPALWALPVGGVVAGLPLLAAIDRSGLLGSSPADLPGGATIAGRLRLWGDAAGLLAEHPATGIGLNNFPLVHGAAPWHPWGYIYQGFPHVHNTLLQSAMDYGLPGLVAVAALGSSIAWASWRSWRRLHGTTLEPLVLGLGMGLVVYALHGVVDTVAIGAKPGFIVWAFFGLIAGIRCRAHRWADVPREAETVADVRTSGRTGASQAPSDAPFAETTPTGAR